MYYSGESVEFISLSRVDTPQAKHIPDEKAVGWSEKPQR